MNLNTRTDAVAAALLAMIAFASVPAVWVYLVQTGLSRDQIASHPIGAWANGEWSWAFSVPAQLALFSAMSGRPVVAVWKPVFVLHLVVIPSTFLYLPILFFSLAFENAWLVLFLSSGSVAYGVYRLSKLIVSGMFKAFLNWHNSLRNRILLAIVMVLPLIMAFLGNSIHLDALYTFP